jgi:hypothetical protein
MNIETSTTREKSLQALREKIAKTTDPKARHALGTEARELRTKISNKDQR